MQELMDLFLKKSKEKHSNIIYAQAYKNGILKAEYKLFPVKTRLNVWSVSKPFVAMAAGIAEKEGIIKRAESIYADFQQYIPEDGKYTRNIEKITVENLLTMSSGLKEPLFFCIRSKIGSAIILQPENLYMNQEPIFYTAILIPISCRAYLKCAREKIC